MQELASKYGQCSLLHLQRHEVLLFVIILMVDLIFWLAILNNRTIIELSVVATRQAPQTSVVHSSVLQGNPKAKQSVRVGMQKSGILMDGDSSSDSWRFENGHGLNDQRTGNADLIADLFNTFSVSDILEDIIMLVQGMRNFVDGVTLIDLQFTIFPNILLEEEANLVS